MTKKSNEEKRIIERILKDTPARIAVARESHYLFFHTYFNQYVQYETADFQREMFKLTEDESTALSVIVAFRDSGKSSIITTSYPLWAILGKQQKKHILILSQTQDKARGHLRNIKHELENNEILRNDLGPFEEEHGEFGVQALVLSKFGAKISTGSVGQSIRGIRHREHRPDLIIADDIEDTQSVKTRKVETKHGTGLLEKFSQQDLEKQRLLPLVTCFTVTQYSSESNLILKLDIKKESTGSIRLWMQMVSHCGWINIQQPSH